MIDPNGTFRLAELKLAGVGEGVVATCFVTVMVMGTVLVVTTTTLGIAFSDATSTPATKWNSLTEDTPRDAVTNALRLHLHNFAYKTFKINASVVCLLLDVGNDGPVTCRCLDIVTQLRHCPGIS
jgi:hypothetical protein